jgi:uncharacterized protein (DUF1501 family)
MCDHHKKNNKDFTPKKRNGSALSDGKAHGNDHKKWSRRSFLSALGLTGGMGMLLGKIPLTAMGASPLQAALASSDNDRILVLIRLKGGNDGLNTIVPLYNYDTYNMYRPDIALPTSQLINLGDEQAMPNFMQSLQPAWNDGYMKVVNGVGYPGQNLSHFGSSDIWSSASGNDPIGTTGWLGRFFDTEYPDFLTSPPAIPPAVQIGNSSSMVFKGNIADMGLSVANPNELYEIAQTGALYDVTAVPDCYYGEQLAFARTVANSTFIYAETINNAYEAASNGVDYATGISNQRGYYLANQMAIVARLIKGDLGTKIYMVELGGFDTHEGQENLHPILMESVAASVRNFFADLAIDGLGSKVLAMTVSEFGRRIEQNGSLGTDHGAAAPVMLFGGELDSSSEGFIGTPPDLNNPDEQGNLQFGIDFRQIYATVLEHWLCIDPSTVDAIMGESFNRLANLVVACGATTGVYSNHAAAYLPIEHRALYTGGRGVVIDYKLPESARVKVAVYNMLGQPVATLFEGNQTAGHYQYNFTSPNRYLPMGQYVYRIEVNDRAYSNTIAALGRR